MAAQVTRHKPRVGIIGGSGPEAGADLFLKLQAAHRARLGAAYATDRDALDVLLWSVSGVGGPRDDPRELDATKTVSADFLAASDDRRRGRGRDASSRGLRGADRGSVARSWGGSRAADD